jgi:hypothetical protein
VRKPIRWKRLAAWQVIWETVSHLDSNLSETPETPETVSHLDSNLSETPETPETPENLDIQIE